MMDGIGIPAAVPWSCYKGKRWPIIGEVLNSWFQKPAPHEETEVKWLGHVAGHPGELAL